MAVRPIDAEKYMELLKEQYQHNKSLGDSKAARAWQGAIPGRRAHGVGHPEGPTVRGECGDLPGLHGHLRGGPAG